MANMASWLLIVAVYCAGYTVAASSEDKLQLVVSALEKGLEFMQQNHQHINLDGVIGTRMVEGQLVVLLNHLKDPKGPRVSVEMERRLESLKQKATDVSDAAMAFVIASEQKYYARIGEIIQPNFWTQDHPSQDLNPSLATKTTVNGEAMHEQDSDDCLTELFGTSGQTEQTCRISRYCWKLMSAPGYQGYSLSHQLFYMQIAERFGCISNGLKRTVDQLSAGFCATMMVHEKDFVKQGLPEEKRDLFMEIQALCGISGFRQFFTDEWLNMILSWQWKPQGCWGEEHSEKLPGRVKREERVLSDGCESHRTAVALGALTQYVRYIVEFMQKMPPSQLF